MNKKGIIAVVIVILAIAGFVVWGGKGSSTVVNNPVGETPAANVPAGVTKDTYAPVTKDTADTSLLGRLKSASVAAAETGSRVALANGKAQFSAEGVKGTVTIGDIAVAKTVGGANYVVTTLGVNTGGSTYQYAVLFTDKNGTLTDQSYALIGSGTVIKGVRADEISGGLVVTITYTAAGKNKTKILVVENGLFNSAKEINL
ncbi:hypothetical protein KW799_00640 [Candidatus Parcubacteria bacterium]|nr:hypothetical protein [Candidatus Parcubacteria bacterium]